MRSRSHNMALRPFFAAVVFLLLSAVATSSFTADVEGEQHRASAVPHIARVHEGRKLLHSLLSSENAKESSDASSERSEDSSGGRRGSGRCKSLGGSVPSANYGIRLDSRKRDEMEDMVDEARRNCRDTRIVLMGDSIIEHLRESRTCTRKIYEKYGGEGIDLGIGRFGARATAMLARDVFEDECLAPQTVYLAVGINDCLGSKDYRNAIKGILDIVKIIKYYSPDTHVVVQKVLPTSSPYKAASGRRWKDQEYYECVERVNREVGRWIDDNRRSCISHEDMEDLVLDSSGKFRKGIYDDGIHFQGRGGDMDSYCTEISEVVGRYSSRPGDR